MNEERFKSPSMELLAIFLKICSVNSLERRLNVMCVCVHCVSCESETFPRPVTKLVDVRSIPYTR